MAARWFSSFLLNAFVNRVRRPIYILIVRFCRSTCEVQTPAEPGSPQITIGTTSILPHVVGHSAARSPLRQQH